jgi:hypothetical protein
VRVSGKWVAVNATITECGGICMTDQRNFKNVHHSPADWTYAARAISVAVSARVRLPVEDNLLISYCLVVQYTVKKVVFTYFSCLTLFT